MFISFILSFILSFIIIKTKSFHRILSEDKVGVNVQKFHELPTPRIGGLSVFLSFVLSAVYFYNQLTVSENTILLIIISSVPVFLIGLLEDLTKSIWPSVRLIFAVVSAILFIYCVHVSLKRIDWPWFDRTLLHIPMLSALVTLFMMVGVSQSTNIIDGFNGLLLGFCVIALSIFLYLSYLVNDTLLIDLISLLLGSVLGLFVFNFPKAKLFTGDGGAYLLGFLLASIALLLVHRHQQISPWCALLVLSYPVFETIFSIFRKKFITKKKVSQPDGVHFHMLIYKRISKRLSLNKDYNNALAAVFIWAMVLLTAWPAVIWPESDRVMILCILVFCVFYLHQYWCFVKFKTTWQHRVFKIIINK